MAAVAAGGDMPGCSARESAFLVDAQDVVERAGEGDEGGALVLGRGREAGVVLWQEDLLEEAVGPGHVGDAASLSSWGRRFWGNMRSERPLASGE